MSKSVTLFLVFFCFTLTSSILATTYYVSPTGTGTGTISSPMSFATAIGKTLTGGDSLIIRGGQYNFTSLQTISKSGTAAKFLHIVAFPGEIPIFDFRTQPYNSSNQGIKISSNYVHFMGITVQGAGDNGIQVTGSNNFLERCTARWNCDSGFQMKTGSDNYILNCDSYENFDYESGGIATPDFGGNADGFADKQYTNTGTNTYKGCRSWRNGDDGWDSFEKIGNTVYDSCWCYAMAPATFDMSQNIRFKTDSASWFYQFKSTNFVMKNYGNGNGFKMGGNYTANNATAHHCLAVGNLVKGYDQNNNNGIMTVSNCTSYNNGSNYGYSNSSYGTLIIKNCVSLSSKGSNSFACKSVTQNNNTWNSGFTTSSSDFVSLDYTQLLNPRKADGSLPEITLLHLVPTSGLIDKGVNLGYTFVGAAPDLGAFEYSSLTAVEPIFGNGQNIQVYVSPDKNIVINGSVASVEIYDLSGKKEFSQRFVAGNLNIPAAGFAKGICLVRVVTPAGESSTRKLLVN